MFNNHISSFCSFFSDLFCAVSRSEMKSMIGIDNIVAHASQQIEVIESSMKYGTGLQEVIEWLS